MPRFIEREGHGNTTAAPVISAHDRRGTWPSISESVAAARASVDECDEVLLLPGWARPRRKDLSWLGKEERKIARGKLGPNRA